MANGLQQYTFEQSLTPCRVALQGVSLATLTGSLANGLYQNGNNGIGATITFPALVVTMDGIIIRKGDRVLFIFTMDVATGIYICTQTGTGATIFERAEDFQSAQQLKAGQFVTIGAGTSSSGASFTLVEPLPNTIGKDIIFFVNSIGSMTAVTLSIATPGQVTTFSTFMTDTVAVNDPTSILAATAGLLQLSGATVINSAYGTRGVVFALPGAAPFLNTGPIAAAGGQLLLSNATVNGANIYALFGFMNQAIGTPTDLSNMAGIAFINSTIDQIGQQILLTGKADYLLNMRSVLSSYYVAAGVGVGSAGDPTKCNAPFVLKCRVDGVDNFIPAFTTNA